MSSARRSYFLLVLLMLAVAGAGCARPTLALGSADRPPRLLSAEEAVDLARFRGYFVPGGVATVPEAREALVAELSWAEASAFLDRAQPGRSGNAAGPTDPTRPIFFVVVRGPVQNQMGDGTPVLGEALAMVLDRENRPYYVGLGAPWDTLTPPGARPIPLRDGPRLSDVSRARAENEIGGSPLVEPAWLPPGLTLDHISINRSGVSADPTGAVFDGTSLTFSYRDGNTRTRLWLTQASFLSEPRVALPSTETRIGGVEGRRYGGQADGQPMIGFAWQRGDRWLYLAADLSSGLSEREVLDLAASIAVNAPRPSVPRTATPPPH